MNPGSTLWNILTVPVCMKKSSVMCKSNVTWLGHPSFVQLFRFHSQALGNEKMLPGAKRVKTQQSILPLIPLTSLMSALGSKAGLQTLLLKHGIDASHLYLCQIYQNISGLSGLGETYNGQGRLNLQRGSCLLKRSCLPQNCNSSIVAMQFYLSKKTNSLGCQQLHQQ